MSFLREDMTKLVGQSWFDERYSGSAYREESALAARVFRAGRHLTFASEGALIHHEATTGGCENRVSLKSMARRIQDSSLEYLFLNQLYAEREWLRAAAPLRFIARAVRDARNRDRVKTALLHYRAYRMGRRSFARE